MVSHSQNTLGPNVHGRYEIIEEKEARKERRGKGEYYGERRTFVRAGRLEGRKEEERKRAEQTIWK